MQLTRADAPVIRRFETASAAIRGLMRYVSSLATWSSWRKNSTSALRHFSQANQRIASRAAIAPVYDTHRQSVQHRGLMDPEKNGRSGRSMNAGKTRMATLMVRHVVRDYSAWRPGFDAHEPSRLAACITNGRVYRKAEDPNDLVLLFDVADVAKAKTWTEGEDLKTVMRNVGVIGAPSIHFIN